MNSECIPCPIRRYRNPSLRNDWQPDAPPDGTIAEPLVLETADRSATSGILYLPARPATNAVIAVMHPRVDFTRHYAIPPLLDAGIPVWAQRSRSVNDDSTLVHERLLLDIAAAHLELERRGLGPVVALGNSGGASLYAFYGQQAALAPAERLAAAPSGMAVDLTTGMPPLAGLALLAPHPGQGDLLLRCIDPAVVDEDDPAATDPELDLFSPANGFRPPPESSSYEAPFLDRYRAAQEERVARIDAAMRARLARGAELARRAEAGDARAARAARAAGYVTVHRTDADPRTVDLSLDPSDRDYGSVHGRRPDVTNFGADGFGRLTTPHAWLSTWSGLSSRALLRHTAPDVRVPVLLVAYTADNSIFPSDVDALARALGTEDVTRADLLADHNGYAPGTERRLPETGSLIAGWVLERHGGRAAGRD